MLAYATSMYMKDQVEPTPTEKKFVHEYVQDFNGAQAYMRATGGTNAKSASVQASKFLKKPRVKTYLEAYTKELLGPKEKTLLGNIDFWVGVRDDPQARLADRLKASESLARYAQMFVEKSEVDLAAKVQIVDDI